MHSKNQFFQQLKKISILNIFMLTVAGIVNAIGVTLFLYPVALYDSGISGTSMPVSSMSTEMAIWGSFLASENSSMALWA